MQPVAAIVDAEHLRRAFGIANRPVEIGYRIKGAALADPFVDRDPVPLAGRVPGIGHKGLVAERGQRRADDLDARAMRPHRHLLQPGDHLLAGDLLLGLGPAVAQIVGAEHDDDMRDPGRRQHVAVEAPHAAVAADVVQDAVAAEPLVHDAHRPAAPFGETAGQLVGPAAERVDRRDVAVGQGVAERDNPAGIFRRDDIDSADKKPLVGQIADRHHGGIGEIAGGRDVVGLPRIAPRDLEIGQHLAGQIEADREIGERRRVELDRIADDQRAGRDDGGVIPTEGQRLVRARNDARPLITDPDAGRGDHQWPRAIGIRDPHPQRVAAEAEARHHPQCVIVEPDNAFRWRRRRRPAADPMLVVLHRFLRSAVAGSCRPLALAGNPFRAQMPLHL